MIGLAPRVVAIDDEPKHLSGLMEALSRHGIACLPIHFSGEYSCQECPHVRVIFVDLHLTAGSAGTHNQDFAVIGGLLEDGIKPVGPYFLILWTRYPGQADALHKVLIERLQLITPPLAVHPLDKNQYLDVQGTVKDVEGLIGVIDELIRSELQVAALLNWEGRIVEAAAGTVSSIDELGRTSGKAGRNVLIGRRLRHLANAARGEHTDKDIFRAINEALLPILADRIVTLPARAEDERLWEKALGETEGGEPLNREEVARLNGLLHIARAEGVDGRERGAVVGLPQKYAGNFAELFGLAEDEAAQKQFLWKRTGTQPPDFDWVLVQMQAACDYAQMQPGSLPFVLGLCLPESERRSGTAPAALWRSPAFEFRGRVQRLHVSARFQVPVPRNEAASAELLFRLREQILNGLAYHVHSYGARPGFISVG